VAVVGLRDQEQALANPSPLLFGRLPLLVFFFFSLVVLLLFLLVFLLFLLLVFFPLLVFLLLALNAALDPVTLCKKNVSENGQYWDTNNLSFFSCLALRSCDFLSSSFFLFGSVLSETQMPA